MAEQLNPATSTRDVFNAANPARPLESGDPRYVDCTEVRGNEDVVSQLFEIIDWSHEPTAQLFTGHRGCGKSTELLRLKHRLENANFAVIYFQADDLLDLNDVVYSDVLVAIARQVHDGLVNLGVKLSDELLDEVLEWFARVVYEWEDTEAAKAELSSEFRVGLPAALSPLAQMMTKITGQLKTGFESKKTVRRQLDPQISQLIANINLLLLEGEAKLRQDGKRGLVIIIDNLDRISFRTLDEGHRNTHDALYIEHGPQLCSLRSHLVYTVPIAMFYAEQASILRGIFTDHQILPMIKTRHQNGDVFEPGLETLHTILRRRIDLEKVFETAALDLLCEVCGGHPRDLMILVRYACRYAADRFPRPLDLNAAENAVDRLVSEYSRMIPEDHFPLLARVYLQKEIENNQPHQVMLHNLSVLEYRNGAPPWHDVHPVVLRLPKFQEALQDERPDIA